MRGEGEARLSSYARKDAQDKKRTVERLLTLERTLREVHETRAAGDKAAAQAIEASHMRLAQLLTAERTQREGKEKKLREQVQQVSAHCVSPARQPPWRSQSLEQHSPSPHAMGQHEEQLLLPLSVHPHTPHVTAPRPTHPDVLHRRFVRWESNSPTHQGACRAPSPPFQQEPKSSLWDFDVNSLTSELDLFFFSRHEKKSGNDSFGCRNAPLHRLTLHKRFFSSLVFDTVAYSALSAWHTRLAECTYSPPF